MSSYVDLAVLRNTFLAALIAGVGITVAFSVAVRLLSGPSDDAPVGVGAKVTAGVCLAIVAVAVAVGLWAVLAK